MHEVERCGVPFEDKRANKGRTGAPSRGSDAVRGRGSSWWGKGHSRSSEAAPTALSWEPVLLGPGQIESSQYEPRAQQGVGPQPASAR